MKGRRRRPFREAARSAAPPRRRREAPPRPPAREALRADVLKSKGDQKHDAGKHATRKLEADRVRLCEARSKFWGLGKGAKTDLPRGGGHAIRSRRRMFREGRALSRRLHFGLHFRSILGGQVGTILLLGQPGMQTTCPEARLIFRAYLGWGPSTD